LAALTPLPPDVVVDDEANGTYDFVQLFAHDSAEWGRMVLVALASVSRDGLVWMTNPKKSSGVVSDLTRDERWNVVAGAGYDAVANVAIDRTWSAVRFRPAELVKRKSRVRGG